MSDPDTKANPPLTICAHQRADTDALDIRLAALSEMDAPELRVEWRRLYRAHPP